MKLQRKTRKKGGSRIHEKQIKVQKVLNQIDEKEKGERVQLVCVWV